MNTKTLKNPTAAAQGGGERLRLDESAIDAAKRSLEGGAVTPSYGPWREDIIQLLNDALATEIVCTLRYKRHYFTAKGLASPKIAEEFLVHANEETAHGDMLAERIVQLGGEPDLNPEGLSTRSASEYVEGTTLLDMIREDLVAERVAVESYSEIVRYLGEDDPTSRRLMEEILAKEEEHADDLAKLLVRIGSAAKHGDGHPAHGH